MTAQPNLTQQTDPGAMPGSNRAEVPTNPKEGTSMVTHEHTGGKPTTHAHLTVAELCAELGIARSTFYDWRQAKKAPRCIKLPNGDIRVRRADLEAWLESLEDAA